MTALTFLIPLFGVAALAVAYMFAKWVEQQDSGTEKMQRIGAAIREGAMAFLNQEYRVLAGVVAVVALALMAGYWSNQQSHPLVAFAFVYGAASSALAGYLGMRVATLANVRTTAAARTGLNSALVVAFKGGAVMGLSVVGLGILGVGLLFAILNIGFGGEGGWDLSRVVNVVTGFSLGASTIALFARVGGGIYTKAADVGADLVGKVEAGIPEDDPRNPATIADNVGDNVGDVAGMGADLFESYVGAIVSTMALGCVYYTGAAELVLLPLLLAGVGIVCSIAGTRFVQVEEGGNPQAALNKGTLGAGAVMVLATAVVIGLILPSGGVQLVAGGTIYKAMDLIISVVGGLAAGIAVGYATEYYCSTDNSPVGEIREASRTGPATNIIAGLAVGMRSTAVPIILISIAIIIAYRFGDLYGVALAALGMLSTTGIQLAVDAYGPIADNAGGIAEMAHLPPEVRGRTDKLDAVGNTTAAIGKGFAIGSAALTALALFAAYRSQAGLTVIDLSSTDVMVGLLIGGMLPFLFSSMAMTAVGEAAKDMVEEVRRQFRTIPELAAVLAVFKREAAGETVSDAEKDKAFAAAEGKPEYGKCVAISTAAAIKRMMLPGALAIVSPVVMGMWSPYALGGLLAGCTVTGVLMAIFMSNAGGAWDNAKKKIEGEGKDLAKDSGKGSPSHKAAVTGDTVGDPFKDTAGPSLNILIKLMSVVALILAPLVAVSPTEGAAPAAGAPAAAAAIVGGGDVAVATFFVAPKLVLEPPYGRKLEPVTGAETVEVVVQGKKVALFDGRGLAKPEGVFAMAQLKREKALTAKKGDVVELEVIVHAPEGVKVVSHDKTFKMRVSE